jgi:tetratricopeptide (TPR) repeat protein
MPADYREQLRSDDENVRLQAILAMARSAEPDCAEILAERSATDPSPVVRYHARKALEGLAARKSGERRSATLARSGQMPIAAPLEEFDVIARPPAGSLLAGARETAVAPPPPATDAAPAESSAEHVVVMQRVEQVLSAGSSAQKLRLMEALARTRDRRYLRALDRQALVDGDPAVRESAARTSRALDVETLPPLPAVPAGTPPTGALEFWLHHESALVRAAAIRRGVKDAPAQLAKLAEPLALAEEDAWVAVEWLQAITALGDPSLAGVGAGLLRRRDPHIRSRAAAAWLKLAPEDAMPFVTGLLDDPDDWVREAAFRALEAHSAEYAVGLLEGRVNAAHLTQALRRLQWLSLMDSPRAREAELRLFTRETDGRLLERVMASIAARLPSPDLPCLLTLATAVPVRRPEVLKLAREIKARDSLSDDLFGSLLREYGLEPDEGELGPDGRVRRVRRLRKTVAAMAVAVSRGTQAVTVRMTRRNLSLAAGACAVTGLILMTVFVWLPSRAAREHVATGLTLYDQADSAGCARELEQALAWDPRQARALERMADLALDDGDRTGARDALALLKSVERDSAACQRLSGRLRLAEGDAAGAVRILEEAVSTTGAEALARVDLGRALVAAGKAERAVLELEGAAQTAPGLLWARLELARALGNAGKPREGLELLNRLVADRPALVPARRLQGELALQVADYNRASRAFRVVLESRPWDPGALLGLARALEGLRDPLGAIDAYRQLLSRDADQVDALLALARLTQATGDVPEARRLYQRILARHPGELRAVFGLGLLELESGDPAAAAALFTRAAEAAPRVPELTYNLGLALLRLARLPEASSAFQASLKAKPDQSRCWLGLGYAAQQAGDSAEALRCFEKALELEPVSLEGLANAGAVLITLGQPQRAEKLLRQALSLAPGQKAILANLALLGKRP